MARLLGWRVQRIVIGVGKRLMNTRFLGAPMDIRSIPLEGFVQIAPRNLHLARLKHALIYFAGPGIELLVFFMILSFFGSWGEFITINNDYARIALQSFAFAALVGCCSKFNTFGFITRDGSTPNDGMGILMCLFSTEMDYELWIRETENTDKT